MKSLIVGGFKLVRLFSLFLSFKWWFAPCRVFKWCWYWKTWCQSSQSIADWEISDIWTWSGYLPLTRCLNELRPKAEWYLCCSSCKHTEFIWEWFKTLGALDQPILDYWGTQRRAGLTGLVVNTHDFYSIATPPYFSDISPHPITVLRFPSPIKDIHNTMFVIKP